MKKLKYLLLAVFVSCAFVLAGCGDGQLGVKADANLGNVNAYEVATTAQKEDLTTIVNNQDVSEVSAYRMTMEMSMEEEGETITMNYNAIIAEVEGAMQMAIKMDANIAGEKAGAKIWIKDGVMYMEATAGADDMKKEFGATKIKMPLEVGQEAGILASLEAMETFELGSILEMASTFDFAAEGITVKVNVEDTVKRFEITATDESTDPATVTKMYLVFEDDALSACQLETSMYGAEVKVVISAFDGEIEFPNADGFEDFTIPEIQ